MVNLSSRFLVLGLLAAGSVASAASFTAGNLVVSRLGDGATAASSSAFEVDLLEMTTAGAAVQTIPLPTVVSGANHALTLTETGTSEGAVLRSVDGRYVTVAGYDAPVGTATVSTATGINRTVGRIAFDGTINTTTALDSTTNFTINTFRSALTTNGTDLWVSGTSATTANAGVRYCTLGATTATQISSSVTNVRTLGFFSGQLYIGSGSGSFISINTVGTGFPTTTGQTEVITYPSQTGGSPYGFVFADANTIYVGDDRAVASGGGIQKWTFSGGVWTLAYTMNLGGTLPTGIRQLTGHVEGANFVIYAVSADTTLNKIYSVTDTGAASAFNTVATAGANYLFRGVAFTPQNTAGVSSWSAYN